MYFPIVSELLKLELEKEDLAGEKKVIHTLQV